MYLSFSVLILLDLSYISRFWTQYEAWLSFQTATQDGLRPASEAELRCEIVPMYNTNASFIDGLRDMWAKATPQEAFQKLKQPDCTVTDESDKRRSNSF